MGETGRENDRSRPVVHLSLDGVERDPFAVSNLIQGSRRLQQIAMCVEGDRTRYSRKADLFQARHKNLRIDGICRLHSLDESPRSIVAKGCINEDVSAISPLEPCGKFSALRHFVDRYAIAPSERTFCFLAG